MKKVLKNTGKSYTCNNCGLMVRTDCKEYFCPSCSNVIVGDGAYIQHKTMMIEEKQHKGKHKK